MPTYNISNLDLSLLTTFQYRGEVQVKICRFNKYLHSLFPCYTSGSLLSSGLRVMTSFIIQLMGYVLHEREEMNKGQKDSKFEAKLPEFALFTLHQIAITKLSMGGNSSLRVVT